MKVQRDLYDLLTADGNAVPAFKLPLPAARPALQLFTLCYIATAGAL